ncbi:MAG: ketoacyl-ACP synthase III [Pseudomonadota bacterium]
MKVKILGTGRALPARSLHSADPEIAGIPGGTACSVGVERRFVCENETQVDLAAQACSHALEAADVPAAAIDLVISGSAVPYQPIPAMAPLVMRDLGIPDGAAAAFDINSTCLSFVSALEMAARMIEGRAVKRALVFSAEVASRALPWQAQPDVAALFGDGAAAAVLAASDPGERSEIKAVRLRTHPSGYEACSIGAGGTRYDLEAEQETFMANSKFTMQGKTLFRLASRHFAGFVEDLLSDAGWQRSDVDLVVPHQASPTALEHMIHQTGFKRDRVLRIAARFGNQIAASIPFGLDLAREQGRVSPGKRVLLLGTSAGVSFGGAALVV